jgi:hypothetical protein
MSGRHAQGTSVSLGSPVSVAGWAWGPSGRHARQWRWQGSCLGLQSGVQGTKSQTVKGHLHVWRLNWVLSCEAMDSRAATATVHSGRRNVLARALARGACQKRKLEGLGLRWANIERCRQLRSTHASARLPKMVSPAVQHPVALRSALLLGKLRSGRLGCTPAAHGSKCS